jgi:beta-glucosidase-like glycosyl hydrolase
MYYTEGDAAVGCRAVFAARSRRADPENARRPAREGHRARERAGLFGNKSPEKVAKTINAVQHYLVTETRLKLPAIFHNEALNGVVSAEYKHFPTAIGLAAT